MKKLELIRLYRISGGYMASVYNRSGGYFKEIRFLWYNKKETLYKLRNEYGVICPRGSY